MTDISMAGPTTSKGEIPGTAQKREQPLPLYLAVAENELTPTCVEDFKLCQKYTPSRWRRALPDLGVIEQIRSTPENQRKQAVKRGAFDTLEREVHGMRPAELTVLFCLTDETLEAIEDACRV